MTGSERTRHALALFAPLADGYDRAAALLSLGQERRWRERLIDGLDAHPEDRVLDVCTGTGAVAIALARRYGCQVIGVDQSPDMLAEGDLRIAAAGVGERVTLRQGKAEDLPFEDASFDHLAVTYLLRYVDRPAEVICELARVMRPGGILTSLEFGVPENRLVRIGWRVYVATVLPALGRLLSREWAATARFLARSIPDLYRRFPLPALEQAYRAAGLVDVRVERMLLGSAVLVRARRAGEQT